jgi:hypothetical protein
MVLQKYVMDASWRSEGYDKADVAAILGQHSVLATNFYFLVGYALALRPSFVGPIPVAMQQMIGHLLAQACFYAQEVTRWNLMNEYLFNIPLAEYLYHKEYCPRLHLRLGDLPDDRTAVKMTGFNISQLRKLLQLFGLLDFVHAHHDTELLIGTYNFDAGTGAEKCYRIDPEELLLYSLTKIKTDMTQEAIIDHYFGGDYARWTHGHHWRMLYLDMRYASIIGHEGILRFLPLFGEFRGAIKAYFQKNRLYFDHQGNATLAPGLNELPFNICGFIDNTIDPILVPFSCPVGDYEGAPRRPQFILAQESVYSGYKKLQSTRDGDQGPNALALRADISNDKYGGLSTLVEAPKDHCSSMLDHVQNAAALNDEERDANVHRRARGACLRDHEPSGA